MTYMAKKKTEFTCPHCGRKFSSKQRLDEHIEDMHFDEEEDWDEEEEEDLDEEESDEEEWDEEEP